jgi:hypothetical protein
MSFLSETFGWTDVQLKNEELPEIFPMPIPQSEFLSIDVVTIFSKILTDVLERIHGMTDEQTALMWDNCVKSSKSDGLITMLAKAMSDKADLYLVYEAGIGVIREATSEERNTIQSDYAKAAKSSTGVYVSFKNYKRADMIKLYSALEYSTVAALNKTLNVSAAVQLKFSDLRASVNLIEADTASAQGQALATALLNQRPVMMDAKDSVETAAPDLTATEKAIDFIGAKLAFYLGMPSSYITGEQTGGIGSTGENDMRAVERGLKNYYFSILKPTLEEIFGVKLSYKSQDFRNLTLGLDVLKTFALVDEEFLSKDNKTLIINQAFDLPEDAEGDVVPDPKPVGVQGGVVPSVPPKADAKA